MVDAAVSLSKRGHEVYFITVSPPKEFIRARGAGGTILQLLGHEDNKVTAISKNVGYEFEFGTPEYRAWIYKKLILKLPNGTPLILSDDKGVWEAATYLHSSYPVISVIHSDASHYYNLADKYQTKVNAFVCVSKKITATLKEIIPDFNPNSIYTVSCGINLPDKIKTDKKEGIIKLAYVGRVNNFAKRVSDLIKIAGLLVKENLNFELDIIGDGQQKNELLAQAKESGLEQYVKFYGWLSQEEIYRHLSETDIVLLTSDFEGMPIAMMEAFASGCGMAGTRVSGIEDYEHHPLARYCLGVFKTGDLEDAIMKIKLIAAVPPDARREAARKLAETEFSLEVCLEKYLKITGNLNWHQGPSAPAKIAIRQLLYSRIIAVLRYLKFRAAYLSKKSEVV